MPKCHPHARAQEPPCETFRIFMFTSCDFFRQIYCYNMYVKQEMEAFRSLQQKKQSTRRERKIKKRRKRKKRKKRRRTKRLQQKQRYVPFLLNYLGPKCQHTVTGIVTTYEVT